MLAFLRIMKTSQQVLCFYKNPYYEIENIFAWLYSHLGDTTLPIYVKIQTKLIHLLFYKNNFCPFVTYYN